MKRFLIFAGDVINPQGGWADFLQDSDDRSAAIKCAQEASGDDFPSAWSHVVDTEAGEVIAAFRRGNAEDPALVAC